MERERLNSRQRRKVRSGVRHLLDEEGIRRSEEWKGGLERLLSWFDRNEADMGLSAETWPRREGDRLGGFVGGTGSGTVRGRNAPVEGGRYALVMSRSAHSGSGISVRCLAGTLYLQILGSCENGDGTCEWRVVSDEVQTGLVHRARKGARVRVSCLCRDETFSRFTGAMTAGTWMDHRTKHVSREGSVVSSPEQGFSVRVTALLRLSWEGSARVPTMTLVVGDRLTWAAL